MNSFANIYHTRRRLQEFVKTLIFISHSDWDI